ncbi:MAG: acetolactate synthase [Clostridia bacterium]|nr:acetolactate synthase [Clostridia bacterium]
MIIKQLSVFLENKPGKLCEMVETLANNGIDISALSLADTAEYGVLRLIVDKPDRAKDVFKEEGVIVSVNSVIAVAMDDAIGGSVKILKVLADAGISIEYMYACVGKISGKALMVVRTDNQEMAEEILKNRGFGQINPADIYRI